MQSRYFSFSSLVLMALSCSVGANAQTDQVCKRLNAQLMTIATLEGCTSPVDFCAEGVIVGDGLVQGKTYATILGLIESVGFPGTEPPTTLGYVGDRLIETQKGDLNLRLTGVFDTARGEFSELERVLVDGGTGIFEGATGTVYVTGTSNAAGNEYYGQITGTICHRPGNGK